MAKAKKLEITRTIEALGLKKIGSVVVKDDNPAMRGMIFVVKHLVDVKEIEA